MSYRQISSALLGRPTEYCGTFAFYGSIYSNYKLNSYSLLQIHQPLINTRINLFQKYTHQNLRSIECSSSNILISELFFERYLMQGSPFRAAERLEGFSKPRVWTIMTPLAQKLKATNLGQGFPTWAPPQFYLDSLAKSIKTCNHQYTRSFGSIPFVEAIARFHQSRFPEDFAKINPESDIVISNGGSEGLFCCFMGLLNKDEEVILFDPSYDCYRPQIQMSGGKTVGIPLRPRHQQTKQHIKERVQKEGIKSTQYDQWDIDFQAFQSAINSKTKILLLNSPHNPVGKVFNNQQLDRIVSILQKHPQIIVVEDNVYEGMIFDEMLGSRLPKIAFRKGMHERTVSIYSAGKLLAATGVRSGWVVGPAHLIKSIRSVHQYNVFCYYSVTETAVMESLDLLTQKDNQYLQDYALKFTELRNLLVEQILDSSLNLSFWIPKGGNFILADISNVDIKQEYWADENGARRTRDYAFAMQFLHEQGVCVIPCSPFYSKEHEALGAKYVRFTFCKDKHFILEAGSKMK